MLILGGGRSTLNLERICKDFGRITSDNADLGGPIDTQLGKDPQRLWKDHLWQWKGSAMTLEGSPQLGKDPQWFWKDRLNLERICNDLGRIAWTWKGSAMTLEGLPLPMLILGGGFDWHSTWEGSPLTMLILGGIKRILPKSLRILSKLRWSFQGLCGSFPSWGDPSKVFVDPFQVECWSTSHPPRISIVRGDPSKVFADPFQVECQSTPPSPPLPFPPHLRNDNFQVECQLTPPQISIVRGDPSKVFVDPFQVECRSTPPSPPKKWQLSSWVLIDPPTSVSYRSGPINSFWAKFFTFHCHQNILVRESPCRFRSTYLVRWVVGTFSFRAQQEIRLKSNWTHKFVKSECPRYNWNCSKNEIKFGQILHHLIYHLIFWEKLPMITNYNKNQVMK